MKKGLFNFGLVLIIMGLSTIGTIYLLGKINNYLDRKELENGSN